MSDPLDNYIQYSDSLSKDQESVLFVFKNNWIRNKDRYQFVSERSEIPSKLIAAIHWRESDADFNCYLHQGDRLGRPCVHEPKYPDVPIFNVWEDAAIHALKMQDEARKKLGIDCKSEDLNLLCSFAEAYNGLGYRKKGFHSPYVLSGTTGYISGKYIADGVFSKDAVDKQIGVLPLMRSIT